MSPFKQQLQVRQFAPETDLPRLVRLLTKAEALDQDGEDTSEETQRMYLTLPEHDPMHDRWVIEAPDDPDCLIGYASTWARNVWSEALERAESYIVVHPAWRRRGLGNALLDHILRRARALGTNHVVIHANERNRASNTFLAKRGFKPAGDYWLLRTAIGALPEEPRWPVGYTLRDYAQVQHVPTLVKAMECYRDMWGHYGPRPGAARLPWLSRVNQEGVFLVFAPSGDVAGVCIAEQRQGDSSSGKETTGHINGPGIAPEHRSRGFIVLLSSVLCSGSMRARNA